LGTLSLPSPLVRSPLRMAAIAIPVALLLAGVVRSLAYATRPLREVVDYVYDDAYFYAGIAWSLAHGHGSKFREPLATNGYQPLWLWLLAAGALLFRLGRRGVVAFAILLAALTQATVSGALLFPARYDPRRTALGIAYVVTVFVFNRYIFSIGLETVLLSFGLLVTHDRTLDEGAPRRQVVVLALGFFGLFLARLDTLAWFGAFVLLSTLSSRRSWRNVLVASSIYGALVLSFFLLNQVVFGIPVPISGLAKALGRRGLENVGQVAYAYARVSVYGLQALFVALALGALLARVGVRTSAFGRDIAVSLVVLLVVPLYYGVFSGWRVWQWYLWPPAILLTFSLARALVLALEAWRTRHDWASPGRVALLATVVAVALIPSVFPVFASAMSERSAWLAQDSFNQQNVDLIEAFLARSNVRTVLMGDRGAALGYFLPDDFRFVSAEGLVADAAFLEARRQGRAVQYLDAIGIDSFVVDRDRVLSTESPEGKVYGVIEPVQAHALHEGSYLLCFPESATLYREPGDADPSPVRRVFDFRKHLARCPDAIVAERDALVSHYGGVFDFSLPSLPRYQATGWPSL